MLIADISDQLGNQMFTYASVKTIAEKKGFSFGLCGRSTIASMIQTNNMGMKYTLFFLTYERIFYNSSHLISNTLIQRTEAKKRKSPTPTQHSLFRIRPI